jgi:hypothetical protein
MKDLEKTGKAFVMTTHRPPGMLDGAQAHSHIIVADQIHPCCRTVFTVASVNVGGGLNWSTQHMH